VGGRYGVGENTAFWKLPEFGMVGVWELGE
jgi:hypothetical protein